MHLHSALKIHELILNMPNYYFDIETTGLDPKKDKIVTIQFMELDSFTCQPKGNLVILKEWESSERDILKEFIEHSRITDDYPFSFVPVGYNLKFEHNFLIERTRVNKLQVVDILKRPFIDLIPFGIVMNKGQFKGSGLDKITGKNRPGDMIPKLYAEKNYTEIIKYIENETEEFVKFSSWLYKELPPMLDKFKKEHGINK